MAQVHLAFLKGIYFILVTPLSLGARFFRPSERTAVKSQLHPTNRRIEAKDFKDVF